MDEKAPDAARGGYNVGDYYRVCNRLGDHYTFRRWVDSDRPHIGFRARLHPYRSNRNLGWSSSGLNASANSWVWLQWFLDYGENR